MASETAPERRVAIVGAGLMGSGIAACAAAAGYEVAVHDPSPEALESSRQRIAKGIERIRRKAKEQGVDPGAIERVRWSASIEAAVDGAPLVVEAASEDERTKADVFAALDRLAAPDAVLATNTSSIPIGRVARSVADPSRVLGMHFFSPAESMPLVEIVVALETSDPTVEQARAFCAAIGKQSIEVRDRAGFIVNKLLVPMLLAAVRMLQGGEATAAAIDAGMKLGAGHPMGPLKLIDSIGLDVIESVADCLYDEYRSPELICPPLLRRMVDAGQLGRKSGRGFHEYDAA